MRSAALLVVSILCVSCATTPSVPPESVSYAPSLGVDLDAMERLPSGVLTRDMTEGSGDPVRAGQWVRVHYVGWLPDGTQFDAAAPPGDPVRFRLGTREVIRGWDEGIVGMRPGGQRMLVVPAELGYRGGTAGIPANSVLVFLIELTGVGE